MYAAKYFVLTKHSIAMDFVCNEFLTATILHAINLELFRTLGYIVH